MSRDFNFKVFCGFDGSARRALSDICEPEGFLLEREAGDSTYRSRSNGSTLRARMGNYSLSFILLTTCFNNGFNEPIAYFRASISAGLLNSIVTILVTATLLLGQTLQQPVDEKLSRTL